MRGIKIMLKKIINVITIISIIIPFYETILTSYKTTVLEAKKLSQSVVGYYQDIENQANAAFGQ